MKRLFCLLALIFALFSSLSLVFGTGFCRISLAVLIVLLVIFAVVSIFTRKHWSYFAVTASLFAVTAILIVAFFAIPKMSSAKALDSKYVTAEGKIISISTSDSHTSLRVKCDVINGVNQSQKISVILKSADASIDVGRRISFAGTLNYDDSFYSKGKESFLTVFPVHYELCDNTDPYGWFVYSLRGKIRQISATMKHSFLVDALMIGDKSGIDYELTESFKLLGTSHLLAISGLHLSIIVMTFYMFLIRVGMHHRISSVISSLLALVYMSITGFSFSLVRAGQMLIVFFLARSVRRQNDSITALFFAGFTILLISPWAIFDISFLLSFFATLGIITFVPPIMQKYRKYLLDKQEKGIRFSRRERLTHKLLQELISASLTTLSATAVTIPIVIFTYNEISIFSLVGNLFTVSLAKYFLMFTFFAVMIECIGISFVALPFKILSSAFGSVFLYLTASLSKIAPPLVSLHPAYLSVGIVITVIMVAVAFCLCRKTLTIPCLILALSIFIPIFNLTSASLVYPTALIDSITKRGANTTLVRWRGSAYILDQTDSASQKTYSLASIAENNQVGEIDNAVFIATKKVPYTRISAILTLFNVEKVTLITQSFDEEGLFELQTLCDTKGVELKVCYAEKAQVANGLTAYCYNGICTAFLIENGDNSLSLYRSLSEGDFVGDLLDADELIFDGKELLGIQKANKIHSYRLTT